MYLQKIKAWLMNITPVNQTPQNHPSFQMNIKISQEDGTLKAFEQGIENYYSNCCPALQKKIFGEEPLNVQKIIKDFCKAFKKYTESEPTDTIIISKDKIPNPVAVGPFFNITHITPKGKKLISRTELAPSMFLPDPFFDKGKPYISATKDIVTELMETLTNSNYKTGIRNNKFHKLLTQLRNDNK
jgi:hypothetical protein